MSGMVALALRVLMTLALYAFLAWAFYALWQDLRQRGEMLALFRIPTLILSTNGESRSFQQAEVILGREMGSDYLLDDPTVSAHHARLSFHHGHWWAEDLNSTNGTTLNGERLSTATVLVDGDVLQLGAVTVTIKILQ
ncbi:MAG: FHA domain-containing protein [Anaerolineales bacterium]